MKLCYPKTSLTHTLFYPYISWGYSHKKGEEFIHCACIPVKSFLFPVWHWVLYPRKKLSCLCSLTCALCQEVWENCIPLTCFERSPICLPTSYSSRFLALVLVSKALDPSACLASCLHFFYSIFTCFLHLFLKTWFMTSWFPANIDCQMVFLQHIETIVGRHHSTSCNVNVINRG